MPDSPDTRRFFVDASVLRARSVTITGDLAHRLARILRLRRGDEVILTSGGPREYMIRLDGVSANAITGVVIDEHPAPAEATVEVVLYQSLIRPNRFDLALEKGTEIGVARFVPVINARSQVTEEASSARSERWRRLIIEAAEQCGRGRLPTVADAQPFEDAVRTAPGLKIVPWEAERHARLSSYLHSLPERPRTVSVFIGPEGGYTDDEVALARESGAALVTLGRRVFRSETAAIVACGIILHELDH
jgi:16S rRNA (uracil1498-N3)-methyltransferase